ncbi:MAG: DUF928 domain-containing protein [Cyanobacteria bacterium P01_A01_bin.84]
MKHNTLTPKPNKLITLFYLLTAIALGYSSPAQAVDLVSKSANNLIAQQVPKDLGSPETGRRRGGGSRNDCPKLEIPVTALVPGDKTGKKSILSSTIATFPSFWVFLPNLPENINTGEFVLQDKEGEDIYRGMLKLPRKSGITEIKLPSQPKYALKEGEKYQWYFKVFCGEPDKKTQYFHVNAWVKRIAATPALVQQLKANKSQEYKVYAKNNILHDALSSLATSRAASPNSSILVQNWKQLMTTLGLPEFSEISTFQTADVKK